MFIQFKTPDISEYCNKLIKSYYDVVNLQNNITITNNNNYGSFRVLSDTSALVFINILYDVANGSGSISKQLYVTYTNNLFNGVFNVVSL